MPIINQPFQAQLGNILKQHMASQYSMLTIFSAFAKNSGVLRLKHDFESFRDRGGLIRAFIGVDLEGTSYEALLNLFNLCDELYIVHSENAATTYHSKIYLLESEETAWCAIGSNNLTGGGLWTNFESFSIQTFHLPEEQQELENLYAVIDKYRDPDYKCSGQITSIEDIDALLNAKYISKEVTQKIQTIEKQRNQRKQQKKNTLFGSEKVSLPSISMERLQKKDAGKEPSDILLDYTLVKKTSSGVPAFTNEQFWFEMRKSTGGSRNILDLSKLGRIEAGSVTGTPYEYSDPTRMYGGVKFFDIDPDETGAEKNITINYLGRDYFPSTIKFTPGNGSWRIQLKGAPLDGTEELPKYGNRGDFVHKILIFEKISSDYYVLSLLEDSELDHIKALSRVWARNGSSPSSKAYGML